MPFPGIFPIALYAGKEVVFPSVVATNTFTDADGNATVNAALPADIQVDDMVIVFIGGFNALTTAFVTTPGGWTQLFNVEVADDVFCLAAFCRRATEPGGGSVAVGVGSGGVYAGTSYRIAGDQGTPQAAVTNGSGVSPDPPNLAPSWGNAKTLWLAACSCLNAAADLSAPASFGALLQAFIGGEQFEVASAQRQLEAASNNPGAFAGALNDVWIAATVAIRPAE
jgi:hypothetical protein